MWSRWKGARALLGDTWLAGKYEAGRRPDSDSRPTPTEVTLIYVLLALIASARVGSR